MLELDMQTYLNLFYLFYCSYYLFNFNLNGLIFECFDEF